MAPAAALCATHLHDGAGARAVVAEVMLAPSGSSGRDGTGARGAGALQASEQSGRHAAYQLFCTSLDLSRLLGMLASAQRAAACFAARTANSDPASSGRCLG